MSYHELIYTIIVTAVSTAITMGATLCVGKVVQLTGSLASTATKELSKSASKTLLGLLQPTAGFSAWGVLRAVAKEIGQEVLIDPWIESVVSGWVRRAGGDAMLQMVLSSVAESLRETLTGPFTNLFSSQQSGSASLYEQLDAKYFSKGLTPTVQDLLNSFNDYKAEIDLQIELQKEQMTALGKGFKALTFGLGAVGFGVAQFIGPPTSLLYATLTTFCFSEEISLKRMFSKDFNPVMSAASKVSDVVKNNKWIIINALGIGVIGAMIGVPIAGMLTPFFGPMLGGLITITVMPLLLVGTFKNTGIIKKDIDPDRQRFIEFFEENYLLETKEQLDALIKGYFGDISLSDLNSIIDIYQDYRTVLKSPMNRQGFFEQLSVLFPDLDSNGLSSLISGWTTWHQSKATQSGLSEHRKLKYRTLNSIKNEDNFQDVKNLLALYKNSKLLELEQKKKQTGWIRVTESLQELYSSFLDAEDIKFPTNAFSKMIYPERRGDFITNRQSKTLKGDILHQKNINRLLSQLISN